MSLIITYSNCPVCNSHNIEPVLQAKDHTVSNELFSIWRCNRCTLRFTQQVPLVEDIGKYYQSNDYISHSDTKKGLINRLYHIVRNYTLVRKRKLVQQQSGLLKGNLLDVGAGTGAFVNELLTSGWHATGLEPDKTARQRALENYKLVLQPPDELYHLAENSADVITLWHVLEHVHDLHAYLSQFSRILQQNGTLIIAVPNYTSYDADRYREFWAAYDVPRHLYHFSPQSMRQLLHLHRFYIYAYKPMFFDSFYVSMLSEQYKTGHSSLFRAFITGVLSNINAAGNAVKYSSVIYVAKKIV